jgi:hypothetical protein
MKRHLQKLYRALAVPVILALVVTGLSLSPQTARAAITFDATSFGPYAGPGTPITWNQTTASGASLLIVYTGFYINGGPANNPVVTYNSSSMTSIGYKCATVFDGNYCDEMWETINPTSGTHAIAVSGANTYLSGGAWSFLGTDTTNPVDATSTNEYSSSPTATSTITTISNNDFIVSAITDPNSATITSSNWTTSWNPGGEVAALGIAGLHTGPVGIGAQTGTWTLNGTTNVTIIMTVAIKAAAGGGGGSTSKPQLIQFNFLDKEQATKYNLV